MMVALAASLCFISVSAHADFIDHFATAEDTGQAKIPSVGDSKILVVTIEVEGFEPLDIETIRALFEPEPTSGQPNFTDYFTRMSLGAFRPVAQVLDPVRFESCPLPEDYFGYRNCRIPRNGVGDGGINDALESLEVGINLLEEVLRRVDEEQDVDFSEFDINGPDGQADGEIDGLLLLHNINFGGIAMPVYFLRQGGAIEIDETKINIVGIAESALVGLHEFGHLVGWADLYDESDQTQGLQYSSMGAWLYETNPPALDAFSRTVAGWVEPQVITEGQEVKDLRLRPVVDTGDIVQVGEGDEYFLMENRGALEGDYIDSDIDVRGLAIFHVNMRRYPDAREGNWPLRLLNCANCEPYEPMLMNEQADGKFNLQSRFGQRNDREDLFLPGDEFLPNTINFLPLSKENKAFSSNRYDGAVTGVSVTNIRFDGEDILVDVRIDEPCSIVSCNRDKICEEGRCVPDPDFVPDTDIDPEPEPAPVAPEPEAAPAPVPEEGCRQVGGGASGAWLLVVGLFLMGRRRVG
jgi:M6 family metalloprotease-like protein